MYFLKKIFKFIKAPLKEKKHLIFMVVSRIYFFTLPFFKLFLLPFVSAEKKHNIFCDFKYTIKLFSLKKSIDYRFYLGFKLFYSCTKKNIGIVNHIMHDHIYEKNTCDLLKKSINDNKNPIFIDVGANIGLISLFLLKNFPKIRIFAFEPSPHQYSLLKKTVEENNLLDKIFISDFAVSDKIGEVSFFAHNEANCSGDGFKDTGRGGGGKEIKVKTTSLDYWWREKGKPKVDLIKVDTEGAEFFVFNGAKEMLQKCSPFIFFEMQEVNYRVYNYNWRDILNFFNSIDYDVFTEFGRKLSYENAENLMANNYNFIAKKRINNLL